MVSVCSAWSAGDQPLKHEELAHTNSPRAATAAPATPAAALVEDEPSASVSKRRKVHVDPIARAESGDGTCSGACARCSDFAPGCSTGSTRTLPTAGSGARHEQRRSAGELCCRPQTRRIMWVTDVLCLSAVTIRGLVLEWLDAEGLDVRLGDTWVRQLLHGPLSVLSGPSCPAQQRACQHPCPSRKMRSLHCAHLSPPRELTRTCIHCRTK